MKSINIKEALQAIPDREFNEHIDNKKLLQFRGHLLSDVEESKIWEHLAYCKECRDKLANLPQSNSNLKIVTVAKMAIAASVAIVFFALPSISNYPDEIHFKGAKEEKGFFIKTINYWENRVKDLVEIFTK